MDKEQHEGTYTCEAQNDLNTENPISFNFRLNVEGKRNFLQLPKSKKKKFPQNASLPTDAKMLLIMNLNTQIRRPTVKPRENIQAYI